MDKSTIPQAMIAGIEFFLMNGEIQYIENGAHYSFMDLDVSVADRLRMEIDRDPKVQKGFDLLGITDPIDQLKQFIFCQFGEFDKVADITEDGEIRSEYWDCGRRPCAADGLLCKLPKVANGHLTPREADLIRQLAADQPVKMIADRSHRSPMTIETQMRTIRRKLGCFTRAGVCAFAGQNNLL